MFDIGDYSFAPYKVAISGLHKIPRFRAIGPVNERPVMLDDTSYFVACFSPEQAAFFAALLNDPLCLDFVYSVAFADSKRPITKKLLQRVDLRALLDRTDRQSLLSRAEVELKRLGISTDKQHSSWPPVLEDLLVERLAGSRNSDQIAFEF